MSKLISEERAKRFLVETKAKHPQFKIAYKHEKPTHLWHYIVLFVLYAVAKFAPSLNDFYTTVGYTVYCPRRIDGVETDVDYLRDIHRYYVIRHEVKHIEQMERDGFLKYAFRYLLWPLPILKTHRFEYELEAYSEQMLRDVELYGIVREQTIRWITELLTGPAYLWANPWGKQRIRSHARAIEKLKNIKFSS
jgi:hypothetical protein